VAVSSLPAFGAPGQVSIWKLDSGRGTQTLRGLGVRVEKVAFSADDRLLAAISHDSRIAVWDVQAEKLLHVFEAPPWSGSTMRP
jgi:WD40 repeat protein